MDQHRKAGIDSILQLDVRTLPLYIKPSAEKEKRLAMAVTINNKKGYFHCL